MSRIARAAAALLFACGLGAAPAAGQAIGTQFAISAGRTIPTGDFHATGDGQGFGGGWTAAARVALQRPQSPIELRIEAAFGSNGANDQLKSELTTRLAQPSDETVTLVGANAAVAYALTRGRRVTPSVFGGVGLSHVSIAVTSDTAKAHSSAMRFAWHVGGELAYRAVFLEIRYVAVSAVSGLPRTTFLPLTAGIRFRRLPGI